MITIAPSLLNANTYHIKEMLEQIKAEGIEYLHIDIADGSFVPLMSFGANTVKDLKEETDFILDCHLMVDIPENKVQAIIDAGGDIITVHAEASRHPYRIISMIKNSGKKAGIAINPGTSVETIRELLPIVDLVLVMTVNPGVSGETFIEQTVNKIALLKEIREQRNLTFQIEIDGSISDQTIGICKEAGAEIFVSGNFLFGGNINDRIARLKAAGEK